MLTVQGYFDGVAIRPLEKMVAKPNQRVIITLVDEFVEPAKAVPHKSIRGILSQYADPSLLEKEKGAWERAVVDRYGHV